MTDEPTWPPKPNMPIASGEYDERLTRMLLGSEKFEPMTRKRLQHNLRLGSNLDRQQSNSIVDDYCNRYDIFRDVPENREWLYCSPLLLIPTVMGLAYVELTRVLREVATQHSYAAQEAMWHRSSIVMIIYCGVLISVPITMFLVGMPMRKAIEREAKEAIARVQQAPKESKE